MTFLPVFTFLVLSATASVPSVQAAPQNPACELLTAAERTSLIGEGGQSNSISTSLSSMSCIVQNGDKLINVVQSISASPDAATKRWTSKKEAASGGDLAGWPTTAYAGAIRNAPVVGLLKGKTVIEVRLTDPTPDKAAVTAKLQAVMKAVASRIP
jgi:hypothetical protein